MLAPWKESYHKLRQHIKTQRHYLPTEVGLVKAMVFPVVIYGCESWTYKESWAQKNRCFWTVMLEKTLESPLDCKEIKLVNPQGNQSWIFIGRTDAEAETPIHWPPDGKNWLLGEDPDAGQDWRQEKKGTTEDEMVGWHHNSMDVSLSRLWELVMDREAYRAAVMGLQRVGRDWATELNWTDVAFLIFSVYLHGYIMERIYSIKNIWYRVVWIFLQYTFKFHSILKECIHVSTCKLPYSSNLQSRMP